MSIASRATELDEGFWWSLSLGACFGGNATLIAAAANVAATGVLDRTGRPISFLRFLAVGFPVTDLSLISHPPISSLTQF